MVKRCAYGTCKSDDRYPDRLNGAKFVPFPKPKTNMEKCLRWIKLCGRPHEQLNPAKITFNTYVCTKHFVNQAGPSAEYPDPLPADPYTPKPKVARAPPTKRRRLDFRSPCDSTVLSEIQNIPAESPHESSAVPDIPETVPHSSCMTVNMESQTSGTWVEPMDFMSLAAENLSLQQMLAKSELALVENQRELQEIQKENAMTSKISKTSDFSVNDVLNDDKLMLYYTGFNKATFKAIFQFLVPAENVCPLTYTGKGNLKQVDSLPLEDQFFLTLCKLRNNLDFIDIGVRFGLSQQAAGVIFRSWINYMFLRFGEVGIWPHRDVLSKNMPDDYKKEFPNTFGIVDCTEIKIQKPSSLHTQSQTYSDYKSSNTLKGLVAVDPRGSVIFSSMLFSGSMSDKDIFVKSGFKTSLQKLIDIGHLKQGDGLMGDKGFNIDTEVSSLGLKLNIPPFAASGAQMASNDVEFTKKIAKHRVHVERAIRRIKSFKILSRSLPLSLMSCVNQIWYVCSFLTNFMPPCIKKK